MTREEKISKAAYSQYCNSESICFTLMCDSFKQGAKWADEHPKSPWISVKDDLPCNHEELIRRNAKNAWTVCCIVSNGTCTITDRMSLIEGKWDWGISNVKYWFAIPEPPKEEEIKL